MIKTWLVAAAALAMTTGIALAQTSSSSTTTTQTAVPVPAPVIGSAGSSHTQSTDSNGVMTDKTQTYSNGTSVAPSGSLTTTRKTTSTTTGE